MSSTLQKVNGDPADRRVHFQLEDGSWLCHPDGQRMEFDYDEARKIQLTPSLLDKVRAQSKGIVKPAGTDAGESKTNTAGTAAAAGSKPRTAAAKPRSTASKSPAVKSGAKAGS